MGTSQTPLINARRLTTKNLLYFPPIVLNLLKVSYQQLEMASAPKAFFPPLRLRLQDVAGVSEEPACKDTTMGSPPNPVSTLKLRDLISKHNSGLGKALK